MDRIKLNVLGISYSQTQTGAYALVLAEENGKRRIPIIVGGFEAQAIAIQLEGLRPPRPLTHDLFYNFSVSFDIKVLDVNIYKLEEGVFHSKISCQRDDKLIEIDARTSDAIALALKFRCPIYTEKHIIEKAGIILDFEKEVENLEEEEPGYGTKFPRENIKSGGDFSTYSKSELKGLLDEAINNEDYEKASKIRDELNSRKK